MRCLVCCICMSFIVFSLQAKQQDLSSCCLVLQELRSRICVLISHIGIFSDSVMIMISFIKQESHFRTCCAVKGVRESQRLANNAQDDLMMRCGPSVRGAAKHCKTLTVCMHRSCTWKKQNKIEMRKTAIHSRINLVGF